MLPKKTKSDYEALVQGAEVLERDGFGIKVLRLTGQRILKLFRRKRLLTSQLWVTHASRFSRNASKLQRRGIPTVEVETTFAIPEMERSAVLYKMLQGETLRDWLAGHDTPEKEAKLEALGRFIAQLHQKGILFRSLHLDNVLVLPNGDFGLIDIADTGFRTFGPLSTRQRIRNFHHMDRHDEDRRDLASKGGQKFIQSYMTASALSEKSAQKLSEAFGAIFSEYK